VAERHEDLRPACALAQKPDELAPQGAVRVRRQGRDPLGVEERHARPTDRLAAAIGGFEDHHEQVALVIEDVLPVGKIRQRLQADAPKQLQVPFSPLEGLLHRDDPVPEHAGRGRGPCIGGRDAGDPILHPITRPASLKISLAMMRRWISLVPS
jgi:hypothetical protein